MIISKKTQRHTLAALLLLASGGLHAAGFALIENSASGMGSAFAGAAAIAEDGSTIYFNPAGMTQLEGQQLSGALHLVRPTADFSNQGSTTALGGDLTGPDADGGKDAVVPNLYFSTPINDQLVFGLGINAPFGLETSYEEDWVGRYHAIKSDLVTININPSLAWKASDKLSFGAGLSVQYLHIELTSAIDFGSICLARELSGALPAGTCAAIGAQPQQLDGFADLEAKNFSWGYNLGMLYIPQPDTRIGLAYRSKVQHDVDGEADFTVPAAMAGFATANNMFVDTDLKASVALPESFSASIAHQTTDRLTLLFDWTHTRWSRFKELRIDYDSAQPDSVTTENWNNSNRFALGFNYRLNDAWLLRSGVALDQTPIPDAQHRTPRIPGNDRHWLAIGLGYHMDQALSVDLGYAHLFVKDTPIDHTFESSVPTLEHTLRGQYAASVDIFSVQLNWKF